MMTAKLVITEGATGTVTQVVATFNEEESKTLAAYYRYVEELSEAKLLKDGFPAKVQLEYEAGRGLSHSVQLPPDEDVIVLLHKLRPLILHQEHASYNKVTGIIGKAFEDSNVRLLLKTIRALYDGRNFQKQIVLSTAGTVINSDKVLWNWLNAAQYHRAQDEPKQMMEALDAVLPKEVSRAVFLMLLSDQALAIFDIAHFVGMLIGKAEALEYPVDGPAKVLLIQAVHSYPTNERP